MRELSLHILDALQNSLEAGATLVELIIDEDLPADRLTITIRDNGRGMDEATLARVTDPFFTTRKTRHIGLGIPLFKMAAERCNGGLAITSQVGQGTTLVATFQHSHLDRAPLGDMAGTLLSFILGGMCDVRYVHRRKDAHAAAGARANESVRVPGTLPGAWHADEAIFRTEGKEDTGEQGAWETGAAVHEFAFDTREIKAELGDVPLSHPAVREWLRDFLVEGEAGFPAAG